MSNFSKDDLKALQKLSKIKISPDKEEIVLGNIKKILDYMDMLEEVDTSSTPPLTHVVPGMKARLAEDEICDKLSTEEFLQNAPDKVGTFLKVPAVMEDKGEI